MNGKCFCLPGFRGVYCEKTCDPGYFGEHCQRTCTCFNGATCEPVGEIYLSENFTPLPHLEMLSDAFAVDEF